MTQRFDIQTSPDTEKKPAEYRDAEAVTVDEPVALLDRCFDL